MQRKEIVIDVIGQYYSSINNSKQGKKRLTYRLYIMHSRGTGRREQFKW